MLASYRRAIACVAAVEGDIRAAATRLAVRWERGGRDAALAAAIIALGRELGLRVVAEGVETQAQFQMLTQFGCLQAQGFLLGRPMPAAQALVVLRKPWGNLPRAVPRPATATQRHAS